ncbi:unnamed protein product, partial [Amoebophrya sp. A120]|eukprot:GSA120T00007564001.1
MMAPQLRMLYAFVSTGGFSTLKFISILSFAYINIADGLALQKKADVGDARVLVDNAAYTTSAHHHDDVVPPYDYNPGELLQLEAAAE